MPNKHIRVKRYKEPQGIFDSKPQKEVESVLDSEFWREHALLSFINAYSVLYRKPVSFTTIKWAGIVPQNELAKYLDTLVKDLWIECHGNGKARVYEAKIVY